MSHAPQVSGLDAADRCAAVHSSAAAAAQRGDWPASTRLLERACKLARYGRPELNGQWMVSADRALPRAELPRWALARAREIRAAGQPASALELLQLALVHGAADPETQREARALARAWVLDLVAGAAGEPRPLPAARGPAGPMRVGHLVGCLNPTHAPTKLIATLAAELPARTFVYSSEWAAGWFHNWSAPIQSGPDEFLEPFRRHGLHLEPARGSFVERAARLARRIAADRLDLLVVHASSAEAVTALAAALRPAPRLVNVNHASEMELPCFDGVVHLFANGLSRSAHSTASSAAAVIPPASDMAERLAAARPLARAELGLGPEGTVSGTFGNLYKVDNPDFLDSLRRVLAALPRHRHLFAGGGDSVAIRDALAGWGLSDRARFLGRRTDIPELLGTLDFYLASHPYPGALSEIEAMAAGLPVISMRAAPESHENSGAEVVGLPECLVEPGDSAGVARLAVRFASDAAYGRALGSRLRARYSELFRPAAVAARHLEFYRAIVLR
jgi:glycosyltransferase involved in cell wall biosynthesis